MAGPMGGPKPGGAKAKDFKGSLHRLGKYLKPYRVGLVIVFVAAIMSVVFSIVSPKIMAKITDELMRPILEMVGGNVSPLPIDFSYIFKIILILIGLYVLSAAFNYLQQFIMAGISQKVIYDLRRDIDEKLARLPLKFFDSHTNGELLSRFTNDVDNISGTLQQSITQVITSVTTVIGVLFMMLTISPLLTVVSIIVIPLSGVLMMLVIKRSQKYFIGQQKELGDLNGHIEEVYSGLNVVRSYNGKKEASKRFDELNKKMYICAFEELDDSKISTIIEPLKGDIKECKRHSDQGQWKGEIEIEEDIIAVKRIVAKIAVNTWAYLYGEDEVQDNKFDCIKEFILSDESKEGLVSYLPPDTMIKEDCHIGKEHCCLFTVQAGIVYAIIFLYNSGFAVKLFPVEETFKWVGKQIENYIFNGYVCDWMNHEDYEYKEYYHK